MARLHLTRWARIEEGPTVSSFQSCYKLILFSLYFVAELTSYNGGHHICCCLWACWDDVRWNILNIIVTRTSTTNILMKARKGAEQYWCVDDETRDNWCSLSSVNILSVTNLNKFSTVQYSALQCAQIIITFKLLTDATKHELCCRKKWGICLKFKVLAVRTVNVKITEELKTTPISGKK